MCVSCRERALYGTSFCRYFPLFLIPTHIYFYTVYVPINNTKCSKCYVQSVISASAFYGLMQAYQTKDEKKFRRAMHTL